LDIIDILDEEVPLDEEKTFSRYLFTYPSDGLNIYGYINTLDEGYKFPVAILLHGYIPPDEYDIVDYTDRYATSLVEAGYFVIHPNFRNYPPSDSGPDPFRIGYAIDILNLIAIIREQSKDPDGYLRRADADNIHLWGHSMGGGVALRVLAVNTEEYIRGAVLYGSMSGNEVWNYERIREWSGGDRGEFELSASIDMIEAISPIYHLDRITAPISIHHSDADDTVPLAWSEDLCGRLEAINHPVECFTYHAIPHTFNGPGDALFMERVIEFFKQY
jgi:dipeptidyl aminopeptidase/acylaminoacyl peptidase